MRVARIISGGQTGADQGALCAGYLLGIETGGWAPRGWRTDDGPEPELAAFGLVEAESADYPARTHLNVRDSDGTLVFGSSDSPGCKLTLRLCEREGKPVRYIPWRGDFDALVRREDAEPEGVRSLLEDVLRTWLVENKVRVLNVAGNRERTNPGIGRATCDFLVGALLDDYPVQCTSGTVATVAPRFHGWTWQCFVPVQARGWTPSHKDAWARVAALRNGPCS